MNIGISRISRESLKFKRRVQKSQVWAVTDDPCPVIPDYPVVPGDPGVPGDQQVGGAQTLPWLRQARVREATLAAAAATLLHYTLGLGNKLLKMLLETL